MTNHVDRDWSIFDRLFDEFYSDAFRRTHSPQQVASPEKERFRPRVDISETEKAYFIKADLPGLDEDKLEINVNEGVLSMKGTTAKAEAPNEEKLTPLHRERARGEFERSFRLDRSIDSEGIKARLSEGVLTLTLPKQAEARPRRIQISG
ncbi:MAG: Hsp20/alpha crystallin family protein [Planctomycetes bacterium]|nr:Hsp20/alpha crystallin family protein [Planctomycetota bacterium]